MTEEDKVKAARVARVIASDISLYNEARIIKGIEEDNLFEVLKDEIEEHRQMYKNKVSPEIQKVTNYFERAVIDLIVKPKGHVKSKIW